MMRFLWVFLAVLLLCGAAVAFELNSRTAAIATDGASSPETVYFQNAVDADTLEYVSGFSAWSTAVFGMKTVPWTGAGAAADTLQAHEDSLICPAAGVTVVGRTRFVIIYDQSAQVNIYGWND